MNPVFKVVYSESFYIGEAFSDVWFFLPLTRQIPNQDEVLSNQHAIQPQVC